MLNYTAEPTHNGRISGRRDRSLPENEKFYVHSRALSAAIGEFALEGLSGCKRSAPNIKIPEVAFQKFNAQMITHWFFLPIDKKNSDTPQSRARLLSSGIVNIDQLEADTEPITSSIALMYSEAAQQIAEGAPIPEDFDKAELVDFLTYLSARFSAMNSKKFGTSNNDVRTRFLTGVYRFSAEHINKINLRLKIIRADGPLTTRIKKVTNINQVSTNPPKTRSKTTSELRSSLV